MANTPELRSERLSLSPLQVTDSAAMAEVLSAAEIYTFTGGSPPTTAELEARYRSQVSGPSDPNDAWHNWIVNLDGKPIGYVQATIDLANHAEVAWVIGPQWQGHGYAKEAARAIVAWISGLGIAKIVALVHPGHLASQRVAAAIGLVRTNEIVDGEEVWTSAYG